MKASHAVSQEKLVYRNNNRQDEFLQAAKAVSKKVSTIEGVVGILATGGIARGYCDDYSDLDLIVYANEGKVAEIGNYIAVGWLMYKNIGLDTPVESYEKALQADSPSDYWSQVMRWDRQNSILLFDSEDRIRDLLRAKLVFPERERQQLQKEYADKVEEYLVHSFDMWEQRGALVNLADLLITSTKYLIQWIYASNGKFQPYLPKWLFSLGSAKVADTTIYGRKGSEMVICATYSAAIYGQNRRFLRKMAIYGGQSQVSGT